MKKNALIALKIVQKESYQVIDSWAHFYPNY